MHHRQHLVFRQCPVLKVLNPGREALCILTVQHVAVDRGTPEPSHTRGGNEEQISSRGSPVIHISLLVQQPCPIGDEGDG